MIEIIFSILIFSTGIYTSYIYFFYCGLKKNKIIKSENELMVSVVIPAHNEENNILLLLNSLKNQNYPRDKFEVIIVDDNSTDKTKLLVEIFSSENINFKIISSTKIVDGLSPKVVAQNHGIENSRNEIIILTDADCVVNENWIKSLVSNFENGTAIVTGATIFNKRNNNFLFSMQQLDYSSHNAISAGTIGQNLITNANGTNFAIRRIALNQVGGILQVAKHFSGEDSCLAQLFTNTKWKVKFIFEKDSIVKTNPVESWSEFFNQRIRWSRQTKYYSVPLKIFLYSTALMHIILLFALPLSVIYFHPLPFAVFVTKIFFDYLFLNKYFTLIDKRELMKDFLKAELFHLPTTLYIALFGYFGKIIWKRK